jgi:hypothetical protein
MAEERSLEMCPDLKISQQFEWACDACACIVDDNVYAAETIEGRRDFPT